MNRFLKTVNRLLFLTASAVLFVACSEERESYTVKKEAIVEAVYSSITVEPMDMYNVKSSVAGYLDMLHVKEGDVVRSGDPLFVVRDIASNSNASNARIAYDLAVNNLRGDQSVLDDLKLEIANAKLKRKNDSINYSRNQTLYDNGAITLVELEQSELMFSSAKSAHEGLINRYDRTKRELSSAMRQARNNYEASTSRSGDSKLVSRINGKVYSVNKEEGELVSMQEQLAIIGSDSTFKIRMLVDEVDIRRLKEDQKIIIRLESYNDETFEGRVSKILPMMDQQTQTFEVEGVFTKQPERLYLGLTGEASIVIAERENVLLIPREYIVNDNEVETNNGMKKVKVGIKSLSHAEILEGLNEGDVILKPQE